MDPTKFAQTNLLEAADIVREIGLKDAFASLIGDVWRSSADRFEPDELGDTHLTLALSAIESFKTRSSRRYRGDSRELAADAWEIEGLRLDFENNAPQFTLRGPDGFPMRIIVVKTPVVDERRPNFTTMAEWKKSESKIRHAAANRNSLALGGFRSSEPGQQDLFGHDPTSHTVSDFMLLWAGDTTTGLTAGWLGTPVLGALPFVATASLWFDADVNPGGKMRLPGDDKTGPSFDQRLTPRPAVTIKPRTGEREA